MRAVVPALLLAGVATSARGGDDFAATARPLLAAHCVSCHGPGKQRGGLRLDTEAGALAGGDSGPAVVAGKPDESLLVKLAAGGDPERVMPPKGERLTAGQLATLRGWVARAKPAAGPVADRRDWWSLRPLARPPVPAVEGVRHPIDAFVRATLAEKGLTASPAADRRTLIRRVSFDLTGLPPTFAESEAFAADAAPDAYERLVDRLLASPRYGERWARHWLDVAHYGDSHGYDKDQPRPNAWPYRDYVIRAFNADKPYGRFVREQVAGDVLYPGTADGVVALGFLAAGPWDFIGHAEVSEDKVDGKVARHLDRDDMVATTMTTFVSLTAQCAQCHNHKFDPVTQAEYYQLQAVFAAVDRADRPYPGGRVYAATVHAGSGAFRGTGPTGTPRTIRVLSRGDVTAPGDAVGPAAPAVFKDFPGTFALPPGHAEGDRRAALAKWLGDRRNPLTWRSIVNRVWQYHFGRGLAATPGDFGRMGTPPTHPELLDYLAADFRDGGQSLKALHRLIVTSATYKQSSFDDTKNAAADAGNAFLWRANRRKLEAEAIRDTALLAAGKLDLTMYGPPFRDFVVEHPEHSPHYEYHLFDPADPSAYRRSVYRFLARSKPQPLMAALDCADPSMQVDQRVETLSPLQALALFNNAFMLTAAKHLAERVAGEEGDEARVRAAFRHALSRDPTRPELDALTAHARKHGLPNACRVILNLNEFVFAD